jgi:hypothetical protein
VKKYWKMAVFSFCILVNVSCEKIELGNGEEEKQDAPETAAILQEEALKHMAAGEFDAARTKFEEAWTAAPGESSTIIYSALTNLAALCVDKKIASIMKEKLGFKNYPENINAILDTSWIQSIEQPAWLTVSGTSDAEEEEAAEAETEPPPPPPRRDTLWLESPACGEYRGSESRRL